MSDLIDGFIRMMASEKGFTGPVNIGNPNEFTIRQLAELVVELTNSKSTIEYRPLPQDDPLQRCPNISVAQSKLGWAPHVQLREGLQQTIAYFQRTNPTKCGKSR